MANKDIKQKKLPLFDGVMESGLLTESSRNLISEHLEKVIRETLNLKLSRLDKKEDTPIRSTLLKEVSPIKLKSRTLMLLNHYERHYYLKKLSEELAHLNQHLNTLNQVLEREHIEALDYLSYNSITEIPNYVLLQRAIEKEIRESKQFSVLSIDFKNFGLYNYSYGHHFGNLIIEAIGQRIQSLFVDEGYVTHPNADEFYVVLEAAPSEQKLVNMQHLLSLPFYINSQLVYLFANMGVYTVSPQDTVAEVLKNSSTALKLAKKSPSNRYVLRKEHRYNLHFNSHFINDLRKGFLKNELFVVFQPKLDVTTMKVCGAEALIRWDHSTRGMISPQDFIPFAEKTGLISKITEFVLFKLEEAMSEISHLISSPFRLSFNVSSIEINSTEFRKKIERLVKLKYPNIIYEAEVTESIFLDGFEESVESLQYFKHLGLSLSMDDFGTGFSSLSYLAALPIDYIKIDQSFVRHALDDERRLVIIQLIIDMAKRLGVGLVAEGVENQQQSQLLRNLGCSIHQGYLYSKPVSLNEFLPLLKG